MIDIADLKNSLRLNNINNDLTDDDLENWIDFKINEVTALTGLPVIPVSRKYFNPNFKGKLIELNYYPVVDINVISVNGESLIQDKDYVLDENAGIIYLTDFYKGLLVINYVQGINDSTLNKVNQLIRDMIIYSLKSDGNIDGSVSSIHESDQSISYDTSNSLGNRIYMRIDELKKLYSNPARVKWL